MFINCSNKTFKNYISLTNVPSRYIEHLNVCLFQN